MWPPWAPSPPRPPSPLPSVASVVSAASVASGTPCGLRGLCGLHGLCGFRWGLGNLPVPCQVSAASSRPPRSLCALRSRPSCMSPALPRPELLRSLLALRTALAQLSLGDRTLLPALAAAIGSASSTATASDATEVRRTNPRGAKATSTSQRSRGSKTSRKSGAKWKEKTTKRKTKSTQGQLPIISRRPQRRSNIHFRTSYLTV